MNAKFKQGDVAQIRCALVSNVNTLTDINGKKSGDQKSGDHKSTRGH